MQNNRLNITTMSDIHTRRIDDLRHYMLQNGIYALIIPQTDPHQSEYIAAHWQLRRYLSGFTGSAGTLVITRTEALLWTDSRYFIQAAKQLEGTGITLMKEGLEETPSITAYLCAHVPAGNVVTIDGMLFSRQETALMRTELERHNIILQTGFTLPDSIWPDRPALPKDKIFEHKMEYAGESATDKIKRVLENAAAQGAEDALICALDEIAWVLNIRSTDVPCNPVATSFLYLSPAGSTLFIDPDKVDDAAAAHLAAAGVATEPYNAIIPALETVADRKVLAQPSRTAVRLWNALRNNVVAGESPVAIPKGCKNEVQTEGTRNAMKRDGVALVKSFIEIEKRMAEGIHTTETDIADILLRNRSAQPLYFDLSFETIAGYADHGAIVHYTADEESNATLKPTGLLLIDSGAQYFDGTTDITRTICLGTPTEMEKSDFTLVMKGHIALATAIFPAGTRGGQLDALARQFLWKHGLSYLHGTGHGVGHFLNVHEGPQSIRLNDTPTPLYPGMITSDEPGVYRENVHGIRCENLVLTVPAITTEFGRFLKFEPLTMFPFDRSLFNTAMMTEDEIKWVNDYHARVYETLSPDLDATEKEWLKSKTLPLA